jgi:hypothetical protein
LELQTSFFKNRVESRGRIAAQANTSRKISFMGAEKVLSDAPSNCSIEDLTSKKLTDGLAFSFGPAHGLERRALGSPT